MLRLVPKNDVHWQKQIMMIYDDHVSSFPHFFCYMFLWMPRFLHAYEVWINELGSALGPGPSGPLRVIPVIPVIRCDIPGALQAQSIDSWRHLLLGKNGCYSYPMLPC